MENNFKVGDKVYYCQSFIFSDSVVRMAYGEGKIVEAYTHKTDTCIIGNEPKVIEFGQMYDIIPLTGILVNEVEVMSLTSKRIRATKKELFKDFGKEIEAYLQETVKYFSSKFNESYSAYVKFIEEKELKNV